ncbi:MAG TPA: ankyrin repeat domain-containing protein [Candidatus Sulfotelmatobacter sp.]|jgi:ankyrin repeat protein|nr:ankyrin repeat domain-containing protein [Candidatus Sulfotelmatobacter sp.]
MPKQQTERSLRTPGQKSVDRAGRSLLHYAAHEQDLDRAQQLIGEGSDVNLADRDGWTPLHFAAQSHNREIAALLLDSGALIDPRDAHGNTPLSTAVFNSRGRGELIEILRSRGANPFSKNDSGVSPVELARLIANYDVARFFEDLKEV